MYAIDRQAISNLVYNGKVGIPTWPTSDAALDYNPAVHGNKDVYVHGHDAELAKSYAEKSGLIGKTIRIATNGDGNYQTMCEIIQDNLKEIGVDATIVSYDAGTYVSTVMDVSTFDVFLLYVGSPSKIGSDMINGYLQVFPLGWSGPERDQISDLFTQAVSTPDEAKQSELLAQAMDLWDNVHPWYALAEMVDFVAISKDIGGYEYYGDACLHVANWYWNE